MKIVILFVVLAGILIGCGVVFFNWTGNEEVLPPALQDPVGTVTPTEPGVGG